MQQEATGEVPGSERPKGDMIPLLVGLGLKSQY